MRLSTAEKMYNADANAIHVCGIPSTMLMRNAARHVAIAAMEIMGDNRTAAVICGAGNNGGDGIGAAAVLLHHGVRVRVWLVGKRSKMTAEAAAMEENLRREGGKLEDFDPNDASIGEYIRTCGVVVDAICGIGLSRKLSGAFLKAIRLINTSGVPAVAADIPSGVAADTGAVPGEAVQCVRTVTFSRAKPGHYLEPGCIYCGRVQVVSIGVPEEALAECETDVSAVHIEDISLPARQPLSHKGDFGKVLIVGGSVGYTGAPNLAARAAVRTGAGLVYLGVPEKIYDICAVKNEEAMPFPLPCDENGILTGDALPLLRERWKLCNVMAMGPGLGRSEGIKKLVAAAVREFKGTLILDADALWGISENPEVLLKAAGNVVVTPHAGEFARMNGDLTEDRLCNARVFCARWGCTTVLKGHRTVVADTKGESIICAGNPGMAKGGSGDVLTGVMAALCAQFPEKNAPVMAAMIHAYAGDLCAADLGEYGMTPTDIIDRLPAVLKGLRH